MEALILQDFETNVTYDYEPSYQTAPGGGDRRNRHRRTTPDNTPQHNTQSEPTRTSNLHIHALISSILLSQDSPAISPEKADECVALLTDLKESCANAGIPFGWVLKQPMDLIGDGNNVTPLVFEILRAPDAMARGGTGWKENSSVLQFLVEETSGKEEELEWAVRKACLQRMADQEHDSALLAARGVSPEKDANDLFQFIMSLIRLRRNSQAVGVRDVEIGGDGVGYDLTLTEANHDAGTYLSAPISSFTALVSIPSFASSLRTLQQSLEKDMELPREKRRLAFNSTRYQFGSQNNDATRPSSDYSYRDGEIDRSESVGELEVYIPIQLLAAKRAWKLDVASNSLRLTLLDAIESSAGGVTVDARVRVIAGSAPTISSASSVYQAGSGGMTMTSSASTVTLGIHAPIVPSDNPSRAMSSHSFSSLGTGAPLASTSELTFSDPFSDDNVASDEGDHTTIKSIHYKLSSNQDSSRNSSTNLKSDSTLSNNISLDSFTTNNNEFINNTFLLPRRVLTPVLQSGIHSTTIKPCFMPSSGFGSGQQVRGFDDRLMLLDGEEELLLELIVKVEYENASPNKSDDGKSKRKEKKKSGQDAPDTSLSSPITAPDIGGEIADNYNNNNIKQTHEEDWEDLYVPRTSSPLPYPESSSSTRQNNELEAGPSESSTSQQLTTENINNINNDLFSETGSELESISSISEPSETSTDTESDISFEDETYDHLHDPEIVPAGWVKASYSGRDEDV